MKISFDEWAELGMCWLAFVIVGLLIGTPVWIISALSGAFGWSVAAVHARRKRK